MMQEQDWIRIPIPIADERDRRELCAILGSAGLEVRIVRIRATKSASTQRYVEYRDTGSHKPKTIT